MNTLQVTTKPLLVERIYTHNGTNININIRIDFKNKTISLLDENSKKKNWMFTSRGIEYMKEWDDIFVAMRECTKFAAIELQQYIDDETSRIVKLSEEFGKMK